MAYASETMDEPSLGSIIQDCKNGFPMFSGLIHDPNRNSMDGAKEH